MARMIFVNLPVADLAAARRFYEAIGAVNEPNFTDETAAAMVFSETIHVMLLTHDKYRQFTAKRIADAREVSEVIVALSCENRAEVDEMADKALTAGGREARPAEDMGFMYLRAFEDPDGHIWESLWMDVDAAKQAMAGQRETASA